MKKAFPAFHAFTIKHNGRVNRIITELKVFPPFQPSNPPDPLPPHQQTTALWDTGATHSLINKATADSLGLAQVGTTNVRHAGGVSQSKTYLVNLLLPNNVGAAGVLVCECPSIAGEAGAIIGMDIIGKGDFAITNVDGKTWMTYRIPSVETIDYVAIAKKIKFAGINPNDKCPCGSGKKFKKCCKP